MRKMPVLETRTHGVNEVGLVSRRDPGSRVEIVHLRRQQGVPVLSRLRLSIGVQDRRGEKTVGVARDDRASLESGSVVNTGEPADSIGAGARAIVHRETTEDVSRTWITWVPERDERIV